MYVNKCIKCGAEFETKNPKRVICPSCLYAEKSASSTDENENKEGGQPLQSYSSYSMEDRPQRQYDRNNYQRPRNNNYGYNRNNNRNNQGGGGNYQNGGNYQQRRPYDNNRRPQQGGGNNRFQQNRRPQQGGGNNRFQQNRRPKPQNKRPAKPLLISKEQLEQIELLYKAMLPLPNPDAHEVIGEKLGIEARKVFFGINLVRQKLMLPKLPFPKRKLAMSADQLLAVKSLYEPLLPLPPIGCHKIIAAQLRIDEWRVHVAIKLIRSQLGLDRWNEDRADKPADYLEPKHPQIKAEKKAAKEAKAKEEAEKQVAEETPKEEPVEEIKEEKPKKTTKKTATKKTKKEEEVVTEDTVTEEKPKRGRKPKKKDDEE